MASIKKPISLVALSAAGIHTVTNLPETRNERAKKKSMEEMKRGGGRSLNKRNKSRQRGKKKTKKKTPP